MIYRKHAEKAAQSLQETHSPVPNSDGVREVNEKERVFQKVELKAKENHGWDALLENKKGPSSLRA